MHIKRYLINPTRIFLIHTDWQTKYENSSRFTAEIIIIFSPYPAAMFFNYTLLEELNASQVKVVE
jgi:hypothetical protein